MIIKVESSTYNKLLTILMNVSGYPSPNQELWLKNNPEIKEKSMTLFDKLIKERDSNSESLDLSDHDLDTIRTSLKFILSDYDENDFAAVMDDTKENYSIFLKEMD